MTNTCSEFAFKSDPRVFESRNTSYCLTALSCMSQLELEPSPLLASHSYCYFKIINVSWIHNNTGLRQMHLPYYLTVFWFAARAPQLHVAEHVTCILTIVATTTYFYYCLLSLPNEFCRDSKENLSLVVRM